MLTLTFFCVKLKLVKYQVCNCVTGIAESIRALDFKCLFWFGFLFNSDQIKEDTILEEEKWK